MKTTCSNKRNHGLTLVEVLVIIAVLAIFFSMIDCGVPVNAKRKAQKISCANNLKEIGLAYRLWAGDHNDLYPMELSVTNGGTMELMNGPDAWKTYQVMSNELSTPKILFCPADLARDSYATNFSDDLKNKISYFIGVNATTNLPQAFLSGDDNFEIGGVPVTSGLLEISSNTPIAWSAARHHLSGNIGLVDGSVQGATSFSFQPHGLATNRLAIP